MKTTLRRLPAIRTLPGLRALLASRPLLLLLPALLLASAPRGVSAQEIPNFDYSVDATGRAQITVPSTAEHYYLLYFRADLISGREEVVSMTLGEAGSTTLTESLRAYPAEHYRVVQHLRAAPGDVDGDGIDDVEEFANLGRMNPLNAAREIAIRDGVVAIPDRATFETLSYEGQEVLIDTHLKDLEFVKFYMLGMDTDNPTFYFMNTVTHRAHGQFARAVGIPQGGRGSSVAGQMRGEIVYHPHVIGPNGSLGVYRFEFEPNDRYPFAEVLRGYELMAKNFPLLRNNLAYYPMPNGALPRYREEKALYDASRVAILLEEDILGETRYIAFNKAEGYGLLKVMTLDERPNPRDIVLYEALPNEMPRVGGIITTVPQTPLSHVNLRAIQDGVPNAYIKEALQDPIIASLVGKHVYYRVGDSAFEIRESSLAEVEAHYAKLRPTEPQVPVRDLSQKGILPLDEIGFADWTQFGVKAANVATLRTFGFPEATVQDGFAVPFYFYDEFMKHNDLYRQVQMLLDDPDFQRDYDVQEAKLAELRDTIKAAEMPQWMLDELSALQASFPVDASIRCRSSTNNEDLPGFSGAGFYDSYTHHPDEGHLSKSIKQVYASLWNFRAFDERQFYRVVHDQTAMGVLVHLNFDGELANGVGVSTDPIYQTEETYYLNSQVGENLVTNPDAFSIPEEILLGAKPGSGYNIVRRSNQLPGSEQILSTAKLEEMRGFLGVIDQRFRTLYGVPAGQEFAMEIEYKITAEGVLAIKQARPWHFDGVSVPVDPTATPGGVQPTATPPVPTVVPTVTGPVYRLYIPFVVSGF
jgi:hypothetical protein